MFKSKKDKIIEQLTNEYKTLKDELVKAKTALAAVKNKQFAKFKDMSIKDIMNIDPDEMTFEEMMYFVIFVLPLTTDAQHKLEEMGYGKEDN